MGLKKLNLLNEIEREALQNQFIYSKIGRPLSVSVRTSNVKKASCNSKWYIISAFTRNVRRTANLLCT